MVEAAEAAELFTLVGLAVSLSIFAYLAVRTRNPDVGSVTSFKLGLTIAILVWIIAEILFVYDMGQVGRIVHTIAMLVFPIYFILRAKALFRSSR